MTQIGTTFNEDVVSAVAAPAAPSAIGLIGTDTEADPHVKVALNWPTLVQSLAQAIDAGGDSGTIYEQCRTIYARAPRAAVVFVRYDDTLAGAPLLAAQVAAIRSLRDSWPVAKRKPLILIGHELTYTSLANVPQDTANDVFAALEEVAVALKGIAIADAPYNLTATAIDWATNNSGSRSVSIANRSKIGTSGGFEGTSATLAALRSLLDGRPNGIRLPMEMEPLAGITDTDRQIFYDTEPTSDLQQLVGAGLGVIVYDDGAYRLFGGDLTANSPFDDLVARRVVDHVEVETGVIGRRYIAARRSSTIIDELTLKFQSYLDDAVSGGLLIAGSARPDLDYNRDDSNITDRRAGFIFELSIAVGIRVIATTAQISVARI